MKKFLYIIIFITLSIGGYSQTVKNGILDLRNFDFSKNIKLEGQWEFYPFKFYTPKDFKNQNPLKGVKYVYVPALKPIWKDGQMPDTGYGTYRIIILLPKGHYALEYQFIYSAVKIWANNIFIEELGKLATTKNASKGVYSFDFIPIEYNQQDTLNYLQIIIQIADFYASKKIGITQDIIFGKYKNINKKNNIEKLAFFIILGILFFTFIYHLFLFLFYPVRQELLYVSLFSLILFSRAIFTNVIYLPPINIEIAHRLSFSTAALIPYLLFLIFYKVYRKSFKKYIFIIFSIYTILLTSFYIIFPTIYFDKITVYTLIGSLFIDFYIWGKLLYYSIIKRQQDNKIMLWGLIAVSFLLIGFINDLLFYVRITEIGYISHYVFGIISMFLTLFSTNLIANTFKQNILLKQRLEKQNIILEKKVQERTKELEEKNKELQKLSIIAQKTDNLIAVFDENLKIEWINDSFEKTYHISLDKIKGKLTLLDFSNYPNLPKILNEKLIKGQSVTFQRNINTPSGEKWMQVILTPTLNKNKLQKIICIQTDITEVKNTQNLLYLKKQEIEANIEYAKTIQNALLGDLSIFETYFDGFIIYKPKEIVSGDFYWLKKIEKTKQEPFFYVALVDCTGHGVPGAFMSMIASRLLEEMIILKNINNPAEVLKMLNIEIIKALRQVETHNTDGFDITLLKIQKLSNQNYSITFASASMPFYVYYAKEKNVKRYKGDVYHIGGVIANRLLRFQNFNIVIDKDDIIYLVSDGYINQINKDNKKFSGLNLIKLINNIGKLDFQTQKQIVEKTFEEWKKDVQQRDDMTFIAFRPRF